MSLSKRLLLGLTSVLVGTSVTACGGGNQSAGCADCDEQVTVGGAGGAFSGPMTPMGQKSTGGYETKSEREKLWKKSNIYTEDIRYTQNWSHKTTGKIKFK